MSFYETINQSYYNLPVRLFILVFLWHPNLTTKSIVSLAGFNKIRG